MPWSAGDRGFVFEMQAYFVDMNSQVARTSALHSWGYPNWEFFLLAFIIPLAAGFVSAALLGVLSRVSGIVRAALARAVFVLCWVAIAGPLTYLQIYAFPDSRYNVWNLSQHMGFGWYFTLVCGLVAGCLVTYLLRRERNSAATGSMQSQVMSSTHFGATATLPALYALLIVGVVATIYGFTQAWALGEGRSLDYPAFPWRISGADDTGPIILTPISALAALVLLAVGRIPNPRTDRAPRLAAQGFTILGIALMFLWWVAFPRGYALSKSTTFWFVNLGYGWFLSLAGLLLILGCLLVIDSLDANRRPLIKQ